MRFTGNSMRRASSAAVMPSASRSSRSVARVDGFAHGPVPPQSEVAPTITTLRFPRPSHSVHRSRESLPRALDFDRPWRRRLHSRAADPELAVRVPVPPLGARRQRPADEQDPPRAPQGRVHHADPEAEEAEGHPAGEDPLRRGRAGARDRGAAVRPDGVHRRRSSASGSLARAARSARLERDAGDGAAPDAVAQPSVRRHPALLLPGRGGGDRDLADRGGADPRQGGPPVSRSDRLRQRRGQSGPRAAGAEARHRCRQDHRHGDDHRLADDQRGAPAGQPAVHAQLPGGDPRRNDPRPAAGAPAQRSGQLLRQPRAGAKRHAPRPGAGEDRHHQLPRVPAARDAAAVEGRPRAAAGAGARAADEGDRRADAAACHAGPDGHEAHPGPERRGAPRLPREASPGRTTKAHSRATTARRPSGTGRRRGSGSPGSKPCSGSSACNA